MELKVTCGHYGKFDELTKRLFNFFGHSVLTKTLSLHHIMDALFVMNNLLSLNGGNIMVIQFIETEQVLTLANSYLCLCNLSAGPTRFFQAI